MSSSNSVTKMGGADEDIQGRINQAWGIFNRLNKVWRSGDYCKRTNVTILKSNVVPVSLYGCETLLDF